MAQQTWTDPTLSTSIKVKAVHFAELQDAINAWESAYGITNTTWIQDPPTTSLPVRYITVTEMQDAMDAIDVLLGDKYSWTWTGPTPGSSTGNIVNEDFADISDWLDLDVVNGISTQVTFGGVSCLKLDSGAAAAGTYARRRKTNNTPTRPDVFTFYLKLYHSALGTLGGADHFRAYFSGDEKYFHFTLSTNGLQVYDLSSGWQLVGSAGLVEIGEWQEWEFAVDQSSGVDLCEVWLKDTTNTSGQWLKVGTRIKCGYYYAAATPQYVYLDQVGITTSNRITYVDTCMSSTGGEKIVGGSAANHIDQIRSRVNTIQSADCYLCYNTCDTYTACTTCHSTCYTYTCNTCYSTCHVYTCNWCNNSCYNQTCIVCYNTCYDTYLKGGCDICWSTCYSYTCPACNNSCYITLSCTTCNATCYTTLSCSTCNATCYSTFVCTACYTVANLYPWT